ncbi:MAG: single-stranded-DNA-specific exonuclease RecJ [Alphaproteobacteria bacterium]|nr:single-stranded-DNA-specific exonuclease RecJ [Alphaproteobacteria bacterium]
MRKIVEKSMLGNVWISSGDYEQNLTDTKILINNILKSRGVEGSEDIERFLNPSIKAYMPDPFVLQDMEKAIKVIADSICSNEKIAIYGDYDVDGITSTAVFVKYLRELGVDVSWHLPTREGEGYGLNISAIEQIANSGVKLLISVDCGISGVEEVKYAKEHGLKVVITDHHSPDNILPDADAVVNPKRQDDTSGLTYLAGVGVAFMCVVALNRELRSRNFIDKEINLMDYTDLVALGTICDTMPLIELNRAFVATGLKVMGQYKNLGLKTLMNVAGVKQPSVYVAGFVIGPRINAAGRLDSATPALDLLLTDNQLVALDLAQKLDAMNKERITIQNAVMLSATEMAEKCCKNGKCSVFVCDDNWPGGVMGIIAGRLKDKYNLPTCVATRCDGVINGSGRSISNVDLGKIIHEALALGILSEGGGHAAAAGFTLSADKEKEFCEFLENSVEKQLDGKKPELEIFVDAEMDAAGANMNFLKKISALAPFGQANPEPTLVLHGATLKYVKYKGSGNTLSGRVRTSNGTELSFVGFNMVGNAIGDFLLDDANTNTTITMLGKLKENDYNGGNQAQFVLEDMAL